MFKEGDRVLLPGKNKYNARAKFKPCRILQVRLGECGYHWEYSLKHEHHEGLFAPGTFFHEANLIRD